VIRNVACEYTVAEEDSVHFLRGFRSALHGFILLEKAGYFTGKQVMADKSFAFMVKGYVDWVKRMETENKKKI